MMTTRKTIMIHSMTFFGFLVSLPIVYNNTNTTLFYKQNPLLLFFTTEHIITL